MDTKKIIGKKFAFQSQLTNIQELSKQFSTASLKVMYVGHNINRTYFTKEVVERNIDSLRNMPVVGEYSEEKKDFKGHGGKMVVEDDKVLFLPTTRPYGVVPNDFTYEWIMEEGDGIEPRETLVIHNIILWTQHYEEAKLALINQLNQSMEIEIIDGDYSVDDDVYIVKDFRFEALCILGNEYNPAFSNSHFFSEMNDFKAEFSKMLKTLSFELNQKEENKEMDEAEKLAFAKKKKEDEEKLKAKEKEKQKAKEDPENEEDEEDKKSAKEGKKSDTKDKKKEDPEKEPEKPEDKAKLEEEIEELKTKLDEKEKELKELRKFKNTVIKDRHEKQFEDLLKKYSLQESDIDVDDIHTYTFTELEDKALIAVGKKAVNGKYTLENIIEENKINISKTANDKESPYGDLFEAFGN